MLYGRFVHQYACNDCIATIAHVERVLKRHSYRVLEITTSLDVDVGTILDVFHKQKVRVLRCTMDRDYSCDTLKTTFPIYLFHRDVTDDHAP